MATLKQIRDALGDTIASGLDPDLRVHVYRQVEKIGALPAVIIEPYTADYVHEFQNGMHIWDFTIYVLVPSNNPDQAQEVLDALISGDGSVSQVLLDTPDLSLDSTDATVYAMRGYGGSFAWYGVNHVGAILKARVITDGQS